MTSMRDRIMARLPPDEAAWLAQRLPDDGPDRAAALRAALDIHPSAWPTVSARALARALDEYLSDGWEQDRLRGAPAAHDPRRRALYRLALTNDGRRLGWRRIHDIATLQENSGKVATGRW
ncbi:MAG: hypothetical protein ABSC06_26415 [Rhodopila sp.]|jgi:hypothetical protein